MLGVLLVQPHANKGCLSKCVISHKTLYHGGWEKYLIELFSHWNHHHLKDLFAKERMHITAEGLAYLGALRKQLDVEHQQCGGSAIPMPAAPRVRSCPFSEPFSCLALQNSWSSRANCLPWVPLTVPEATGLAKVRRCQHNSQCSFSTLSFEADILLRTQRLSPSLEDTPLMFTTYLHFLRRYSLHIWKSLLAWHQGWTLDKQEATAFWPSLPRQACIWHKPWELRVHAEQSIPGLKHLVWKCQTLKTTQSRIFWPWRDEKLSQPCWDSKHS